MLAEPHKRHFVHQTGGIGIAGPQLGLLFLTPGQDRLEPRGRQKDLEIDQGEEGDEGDQLVVGTWPVRQTMGMESISASTRPVTALVAPGPDVTSTTPGLPVERA